MSCVVCFSHSRRQRQQLWSARLAASFMEVVLWLRRMPVEPVCYARHSRFKRFLGASSVTRWMFKTRERDRSLMSNVNVGLDQLMSSCSLSSAVCTRLALLRSCWTTSACSKTSNIYRVARCYNCSRKVQIYLSWAQELFEMTCKLWGEIHRARVVQRVASSSCG